MLQEMSVAVTSISQISVARLRRMLSIRTCNRENARAKTCPEAATLAAVSILVKPEQLQVNAQTRRSYSSIRLAAGSKIPDRKTQIFVNMGAR